MNNDLISREALKEEIKNSVPYVEQERILAIIDDAPTYERRCGMRLIDADALKKEFDDYIKANPNISGIFEVGKFIIDNAPAVEINTNDIEYKAYCKGLEDGKKIARPQGEFAEKLKDRIEKSVCKYCRRNKHCELCEISCVFQIITLTAEEQKGGAE